MRFKLLLLLLLLPAVTIASFHKKYFESDIYFGLSTGSGKIISNNAFKHFKNKVIAKKFERGFSVEKAQGVWLSKKSGEIREPSRVVIVVYKRTEKNKKNIKLVANEYKKKFHQESVLVVTKPVFVSFY
jgi:hypothetical protein